MATNIKTVSTAKELIFDTPLYQEILIDKTNECVINDISDMMSSKSFDGFNPIQKNETTYIVSKKLHYYDSIQPSSLSFEKNSSAFLTLELKLQVVQDFEK